MNKKEIKMQKKEPNKKANKILLVSLILLALIVVFVTIISTIFIKNNEEENEKTKERDVQLEIVEEQSSKKIEIKQDIKEIKISEVEVKVEEGITKIQGLATNKENKEIDEMNLNVKIKFNNNDSLKVFGYIPKMKKKESKKIEIELNKKLNNIKGIEIIEDK